MKTKLSYILLAGIATAATLGSCSASRPGNGRRMTIEPAPLNVSTDSTGHANIDFNLHIPAKYFSNRSRLFVVPTLMAADSIVKSCRPIVLDAPIYSKKRTRHTVIDGEDDPFADIAQRIESVKKPFDTHYAALVAMPDNVDDARLVAIVSADGCGRCTGIDSVDIGNIRRTALAVKTPAAHEEPHAESNATPEYVIREGRGMARLQFVINKYDINLDMGDNRNQLEHMLDDITPILADTTATLTSLSVYGMASADGPLSFNTPLARNRANAAYRWVAERTGRAATLDSIVSIGSRPEGWLPVVKAMTEAGDADSVAVKTILERYDTYDDDVQERFIRQLPCWKRIRERYLPKDRMVEYVYTYKVRAKKTTDYSEEKKKTTKR